jgi:hypothetical protein
MTDNHKCLCYHCAPGEFPKLDESNLRHKSVRFASHGRDVQAVLFDGVDVTVDTVECISGDEGLVVLLSRDSADNSSAHRCRVCGEAPCMSVRLGKVEVVMRKSATVLT